MEDANGWLLPCIASSRQVLCCMHSRIETTRVCIEQALSVPILQHVSAAPSAPIVHRLLPSNLLIGDYSSECVRKHATKVF